MEKLKFVDPFAWKGMVFLTTKQGGALIEFEKVLHNHQEVLNQNKTIHNIITLIA